MSTIQIHLDDSQDGAMIEALKKQFGEKTATKALLAAARSTVKLKEEIAELKRQALRYKLCRHMRALDRAISNNPDFVPHGMIEGVIRLCTQLKKEED